MVPVRFVFFAHRRPLVFLASALAFFLVAFPVAPVAQDLPPTPDQQQPDFSNDVPAHIAIVEGNATLERDGNIVAAEENAPLLAGDRLRTDDGRIEVMFADGSVLDVDRYAALDLMSESLMRLRSGRIRLSIVRVTEALAYRIDAAGSTTTIRTAGEFRLSVLSPKSTEPTLELAVLQGTADLSTDSGRTTVRAGMRAYASERTEPSRPEAFNSSGQTDFDRWCEEQRDARLGAVSTQYLPSELRYYSGAFDDAGDWRYEQSYGYVWYPRVAPTWQPYYYGNWSVVGSFGWFWVGGGRWCWPTHHYGYWGFNNGWYWIPGRHWGPAWVSWGYSPGYVSWCPLGYNGVPVVVAGGHYSRGWTTVPSRTFTAGVAVPRNAVTRPVNSNFAVSRTGPTVATASVRTQARAEPLRSPTGRRAGSGTDVRSPGSGDSPRAVSRTGSLPSSSPTTSSPRSSRGAGVPASPTRSDAIGSAVSRSRTVTPNGSDQPSVRTSDNNARSRVWSSSRPPSDPAPVSSPRSRVVSPPSRSSDPSSPSSPSSMSSPGSRRASPSYRGPSDNPAPSGPPPSSRATPRSTPSAQPPSSGPRPSGPPPAASPRSRGGSVQSGPPPSSSGPPAASAPRSSGSSSSGRGSRGGGASPRTGRGGGR